MSRVLIVLLFLGILAVVESLGEDDLIASLPGVSFDYNFKQYSGYLNASSDAKWKFFYWLTESQTGKSDDDPLIVWFNGGPGCSSVGGMFEELGPFYVDADGKTLYENIFAWNKYANLLAIESPIGVGFSYNVDDSKNYTVGDDLTASQNLAALVDFFTNVQPKYKNRQWFIAGESYAGIYIPSLTSLVLQSIRDGKFPNTNFGGIAIGNGYMNIPLLTNTLVLWANYHGIIGVRDWEALKKTCCPTPVNVDTCDFTSGFDSTYMNHSTSTCGDMVLYYLNITSSSAISTLADPYNFYQDCYKQKYLTNTKNIIHKGLLRTGNAVKSASQLNYDSTDNQFAFPCYNEASATAYLNQPEVQKAFHVNDAWIKGNGKWQDCNDDLGSNYPVKYTDTTNLFNDIISIVTDDHVYVPNFRILIYNGDVDTVCNFLGDARHVDSIADQKGFDPTPRYAWIFRNQLAGYHQSYSKSYKNNNTLFMDVLTVKGSGHFVPNDRQGPSGQMIYNFIKNTGNYNITQEFNDNPTALPPLSTIISDGSSSTTQESTTSSQSSAMANALTIMARVLIVLLFLGILAVVESLGEDDLIASLPGVSFDYNFKQYSGYLNASSDAKWKFFYWLTESQTGKSDDDPLIVWFSGGPGCSSVGGLFEELGPFYVDADGKTLYENIFAWNKYANLLAIESPIGVGFSYNVDDSKNYTVGDDLTASQNLAALVDFFTNVQPKYKNRQWFITGESYAGIYIPSLTSLVLQSIRDGKFPNTNFGGIAIGNGYMNIPLLTNTLVLWANYHGIIGVRDWEALKKTCCPTPVNVDTCDFTSGFDSTYMNHSINECGNKVLYYLNITSSSAISTLADPYNFYQDCYKQKYLTNTKNIIHKGLLRTGNAVQSASQLNYDSTDNQFAFPCYNGDSTNAYLNQLEVQKAFHVNDAWIKGNGKWHGCNDDLNSNYPVKYTDTTNLFNDIISIVTDDHVYVPNFRILIYNGDVDTVCNFLGDARHVDSIANQKGFDPTPRYAWIFRNQLAGYHQSYSKSYKNNNTLFMDVLTVKGSGHFVPNDRQGPSGQMIYNFIKNTGNYNITQEFNNNPTALPPLSMTTSEEYTTGSHPPVVANALTIVSLLLFAAFLN